MIFSNSIFPKFLVKTGFVGPSSFLKGFGWKLRMGPCKIPVGTLFTNYIFLSGVINYDWLIFILLDKI